MAAATFQCGVRVDASVHELASVQREQCACTSALFADLHDPSLPGCGGSMHRFPVNESQRNGGSFVDDSVS